MSALAAPNPVLDHLDALTLEVAADAAAVDGGERDIRPALRRLGEAGLLGLGTDGQPGTVADQAAVIRTLARACTATAFSTWAHRMAIEYVTRWGGDALKAEVLDDLVAGRLPGASAMATAFQDALGLREIPVTATTRPDGGLVLTGSIPWASNLFPDGAFVVLPVRCDDGRRLIVALRTDLPGVTLRPFPPLLALGSTASTSFTLDDVHLPASWVLTERFLDFLRDVRGVFLLLQSAFCFGLADAALDGASGRFDAPPLDVLAPDHEALRARHAELSATHDRLLARGRQIDREIIALRLDVGRHAVEATRHESAACGGAGYVATSATARRLREAAFLPVQTPTEAQLRWELSRSE